MEKEKTIELANKVYRMTLSFPKKEPLRYKMRELADEIAAGFSALEVLRSREGSINSASGENSNVAFYEEDIVKDLEILKSYFEIVKWQNWVSYFDILGLEGEYDKIGEELAGERENLSDSDLDREEEVGQFPVMEEKEDEQQDYAEAEQFEKKSIDYSLDMRKERIINLLKEKGRLQVWEVSRVFPQVSKRTLRRDFVQLLEMGLIERIGQRNETFYKLKSA